MSRFKLISMLAGSALLAMEADLSVSGVIPQTESQANAESHDTQSPLQKMLQLLTEDAVERDFSNALSEYIGQNFENCRIQSVNYNVTNVFLVIQGHVVANDIKLKQSINAGKAVVTLTLHHEKQHPLFLGETITPQQIVQLMYSQKVTDIDAFIYLPPGPRERIERNAANDFSNALRALGLRVEDVVPVE